MQTVQLHDLTFRPIITPEEIANECLAAAEAGAAIVHIHVRHPEDGRPSMEIAHYREVVERIRARNDELILNLTTGPGQRYSPDPDDPRIAAPGTSLLPPLQRVPHVEALRPEICTLDLNTMNSGDQVIMNTPRTARIMAEAVRAVGARPELELFNAGDVALALDLAKKTDLCTPLMVSFVTGINYGWPSRVETLQLALSMLPPDTIWTAFGVGRFSFPMLAQSVLLGGHARIGLEDNIYLEKGVLAEGNAVLCRQACRMIRDLGCAPATPEEARRIIGLI